MGGNQHSEDKVLKENKVETKPVGITINEAIEWLKTLEARSNELRALRAENSSKSIRRYGVGGDKDVTTLPVYSVKKLDVLVNSVAMEIRKLKAAMKATNAVTKVIGYEMNEEALGTIEGADYVEPEPTKT